METILWEKISKKIRRAADEFSGSMGVSVKDLSTENMITINGNESFLAASAIKIPILIEFYRKARTGTLDLAEFTTITDDIKVGGTGVLKELGEVSMTLRDLATLMITVSDNTATNILIDITDMNDINVTLEKLGLRKTRLLRKMQDYEAIAQGKENYSTPNEFTRLMEILYTGEGMDPWVAEETIAVLKKPKTTAINRLLPQEVEVASKYGDMRDSYCDIALVYLPKSPYIISVMTRNIPKSDIRKQKAIDAISNVSKITYDYFSSL